ncbi:MAG TPA: hypothetical protein VFJ82_02585, partial [Longimicrobium sp.]|nr:hypothetical protein [Longimicrobium sp.]
MSTPGIAAASAVEREVIVLLHRVRRRLEQLHRRGNAATLVNVLAGVAATVLVSAVYGESRVGAPVPLAVAIFSAAAALSAWYRHDHVEPALGPLHEALGKLEELEARLGKLEPAQARAILVRIRKTLPHIPTRTLPMEAALGTIDRPEWGTRDLPEYFEVLGTVENVRPRVRVWLTVDRGTARWPKNGAISCGDGVWRQMVHEPNPGPFGLTLWAVTRAADRKLRKWLNTGIRKGDFQGMAPFEGMWLLAHVDGLRIAPTAPAVSGDGAAPPAELSRAAGPGERPAPAIVGVNRAAALPAAPAPASPRRGGTQDTRRAGGRRPRSRHQES